MTVKRFWRYWSILAVMLGWLAYEHDDATSPELVRPRAALSSPVLPSLPSMPDIEENSATLQTSRIWGPVSQQAAATYDQDNPPDWSLIGVYGRGEDMRLLLRFEEDRLPQQELHVGETLPNGDEIVAIKSDGICVTIGKHKTQRWLPIYATGGLVY